MCQVLQVICVDKTGTLTSNAMAAVRMAVPTSTGIASYTMAPSRQPARIRPADKATPLSDPTSVQVCTELQRNGHL